MLSEAVSAQHRVWFELPTVQPPNPKAKPLGTSPHRRKMKKTAEKVHSDPLETKLLCSTAQHSQTDKEPLGSEFTGWTHPL